MTLNCETVLESGAVCGVQARFRCERCERPICGQHRGSEIGPTCHDCDQSPTAVERRAREKWEGLVEALGNSPVPTVSIYWHGPREAGTYRRWVRSGLIWAPVREKRFTDEEHYIGEGWVIPGQWQQSSTAVWHGELETTITSCEAVIVKSPEQSPLFKGAAAARSFLWAARARPNGGYYLATGLTEYYDFLEQRAAFSPNVPAAVYLERLLGRNS